MQCCEELTEERFLFRVSCWHGGWDGERMGVWSGRRCRGRGCGVGFVVIEGTGKLLSENTGCRVVGWRRLLDWGLVMVVGFANVRIGGGAGIGEASIGAARVGIGVVDARDSRIGAGGVRVASVDGGGVGVVCSASVGVSGVGIGGGGVGIVGGVVGGEEIEACAAALLMMVVVMWVLVPPLAARHQGAPPSNGNLE